MNHGVWVNGNGTIRRIHRSLSIAFTAAVIVNIAATIKGVQRPQATWIGLSAFVPLIPLLFTGLYLFAVPYAARRRRERRVETA